MKRQFIAPLVFIMLFAASACSHFTWDDTGDYGGQWYLTQIDTIGKSVSVDYTAEKVFWAIQGKILEVKQLKNKQPGEGKDGIVFHYEQKKDSLLLREPRYSLRMKGDPEVEDVTALKTYGINSLEDSFYVETISGSKMVLRNKLLRLHFKSF